MYTVTLANGIAITCNTMDEVRALKAAFARPLRKAETFRNIYHDIQSDRMARKELFWSKVEAASPFGGGFARFMGGLAAARRRFHDDGGVLGVDYE